MATIEELLKQRAALIKQKGYDELRKEVQQLSDAANKRLKRLGKTEAGRSGRAYQESQNIKYATKGGGKFGVSDIQLSPTDKQAKNANYDEALEKLQDRYELVSGFLKRQSSKISEINRAVSRTEKRIGIPLPLKVSKEDFWSAYRMLEEEYMIGGYNGMYDSTTFQKDLRKLVSGKKSMLRLINEANIQPTGKLDKDISARNSLANILADQKVIRLPDGNELDIRGRKSKEDILELGHILIDTYGAKSNGYGTPPPFGSDVT